MVVSEVPDHIKENRPQWCLVFTLDSYTDVLDILRRTDQYKLTNLKLGTLDPAVIQAQIRDGIRVLGIEFVGQISDDLLNDRRLVLNIDCYKQGFSSRRLFTQGILQQPLRKTVSLCVVKPHILKSHQLSKVLGEIVEKGFDVSSIELANLNKFEVDEIFEV